MKKARTMYIPAGGKKAVWGPVDHNVLPEGVGDVLYVPITETWNSERSAYSSPVTFDEIVAATRAGRRIVANIVNADAQGVVYLGGIYQGSFNEGISEVFFLRFHYNISASAVSFGIIVCTPDGFAGYEIGNLTN